MRSRNRYDSFWPPYVPVAQRRAQARRQTAELRKKKPDLQPISIEGRTIVRSFWGKGWCQQIESFSDYENRLPRGRTYVRNGSVCHLDIAPKHVDALVAGSSLYEVRVDIQPLSPRKWQSLKTHCLGHIGSLIELLRGRFSHEVMQRVTDRKNGLFPLPGEIRYECNCPDWAVMCKHVAAVMYGIGARLDAQPELLFRLRGVDPVELLAAETPVNSLSKSGKRSDKGRQHIATENISDIFGVDLDPEEDAAPHHVPSNPARPKVTKRSPRPATSAPRRKPASTPPASSKKTSPKETGRNRTAQESSGASSKKPNPKKTAKKPFSPSARSVHALRTRLGMSRAAFAQSVGVSPSTIRNWETSPGPISPHARSLAGLRRLAKR